MCHVKPHGMLYTTGRAKEAQLADYRQSSMRCDPALILVRLAEAS